MTSDMRGVGVHGQGGNDLRTEIALLKTPTAQLASNGGSQHPDKRKAGGHGPTLADEIEHLLPTPRASRGASSTETAYKLGAQRSDDARTQGEVVFESPLLPTPTVGNATGGNASRSGDRSDELLLPGLVQAVTEGALLPTPTVVDMGRGKTLAEWEDWTDDMRAKHGNGNGHGASLEIEAQRAAGSAWGPFAFAIDRWERVTGQAAPPPTNPDGKGGAHRLAPQFSEWMMGLPPGHVTAPEIWRGMKPSAARTAQLKAIGNGVVPQHAALAVRSLVAAEWAELRGGAA